MTDETLTDETDPMAIVEKQFAENSAANMVPEKALKPADPLTGWPKGYRAEGNFLFIIGENKKPTKIATAVVPLGRVRNENGTGWGKLFGFIDPAGDWHEITISDAELASDGLCARLADRGLWIDGAQSAKGALITYLTRVEPRTIITVATRPGWHDLGKGLTYLSPLGEAFGPDADLLRLADDAGARDRTKRGTLEGWCKAAGAPFADPAGLFHWCIASTLGVAGAVVELTGLSNCGLNFSGKTSRGKSLAQRLQASVVGNPRPGKSVLFTTRATDNAMENVARAGSGATLALDELSHMDPREVARMVFMLSGETAKARQRADGAMREQKDFRIVFSLSSEFSIKTIVDHARGSYAHGSTVRLLDIDVTGVVNAREIAETVRKGVTENFGHGLPAFIGHLRTAGYVDDPGSITAEIDHLTLALAGDGADPALRRAAGVLALLQWCGKQMQDAKLLPAGDGVETAISVAWRAFLGGYAGAAVKDTGASLIEALQASVASRWDVDVMNAEGTGGYRARVATYDEHMVYVLADQIDALAGGTLGETGTIDALDKAGVLLREEKDRRKSRYLPGAGRTHAKVSHYRLARTMKAYIDAGIDRATAEMLPRFGPSEDEYQTEPVATVHGGNVVDMSERLRAATEAEGRKAKRF